MAKSKKATASKSNSVPAKTASEANTKVARTKAVNTGATKPKTKGTTTGKISKKRARILATKPLTAKKTTYKARAKGKEDSPEPAPSRVYNDELETTGLEWEVENIVDSKMEDGARQYLVKWVGYDDDQNTWEPEVNLRNAADAIANFDIANPDKA